MKMERLDIKEIIRMVMDMDMEDTMQDNADLRESTGAIRFNLYQLIFDVLDGLRRKGWLYLALISIVGTICFFAARFRYSPYYDAYTTFTVNTVSSVNYNTRGQRNNAYQAGE